MGHFWSTFGALLEYFWGTFEVLLEYFWGTFGVLLEYFWGTFGVLLEYFCGTFGVLHPSLVLMTVASFLLLRALLRAMHQQQEAPC